MSRPSPGWIVSGVLFLALGLVMIVPAMLSGDGELSGMQKAFSADNQAMTWWALLFFALGLASTGYWWFARREDRKLQEMADPGAD